ncbi:uncharacterized protein LOC122258574 isoform X1 [Penaeus japonicus]|uniref:uncharacterized protein LOC122258574 isoform X1 n=1 Tax=Penaeus japonicus TaxID=27405 RepID=UPI001C70B443|nr:uncharacterized protein LOC122258574 isoform X1 [Penaeus japonicus]
MFKVLLVTAAVLCLGRALPQSYETLGVLQPESPRELGEYENMVAATIDVLPEITKVLSKVTQNRDAANDSEQIQQMVLDFLPITRKVMEATQKAEGTEIPEDVQHRFNAAERVMPHVVTFMNQLRDMDFFGVSSTTTRPHYALHRSHPLNSQ